LRIVAGKYRGRTLNQFDGEKIRPTLDMVRESLFNIIQNRIFGSDFLDLYCGTGAVGIEALSRGASEVVFNDSSRESIALLKKNLDKIKADEDYEIFNKDAVQFLKTTDKKFDIIFIDPPYKSPNKFDALFFCSLVLKEDGLIIFEDENEWQNEVEGLIVVDKRKYGRAHLTFFKEKK
jgi:16S rRNA (guanine(966)-N(2))-methyltransferase RsmD